MAVVRVHSVGVWRRTLMCSSAEKGKNRFTSWVLSFTLIWRRKKKNARRWCSRGMLHHPAPLDLHPLQHLVLMKPLHRGSKCRYMVWQGLVVRRQVLGQWGTWTREVVGRQRRGRCRGHSVAWRMRWQWWMKGDSVGNNIISLRRGLRCELGVPMGMRTGGGGLMMQWAC